MQFNFTRNSIGYDNVARQTPSSTEIAKIFIDLGTFSLSGDIRFIFRVEDKSEAASLRRDPTAPCM